MAVEIKKEFLDELTEVIQNRDSARAAEMIQDMHPADIAEYFEEMMCLWNSRTTSVKNFSKPSQAT